MKTKLIAAVLNEGITYHIINGSRFLKDVDMITFELIWTDDHNQAWSYPDKQIAQDFLDTVVNQGARNEK